MPSAWDWQWRLCWIQYFSTSPISDSWSSLQRLRTLSVCCGCQICFLRQPNLNPASTTTARVTTVMMPAGFPIIVSRSLRDPNWGTANNELVSVELVAVLSVEFWFAAGRARDGTSDCDSAGAGVSIKAGSGACGTGGCGMGGGGGGEGNNLSLPCSI